MSDEEPTGVEPGSTEPSAADAELADAMESIQSIGEDWRSSERASESDHDGDEKGRSDA